jgi:uncharacterized protein (DUF433 family)
MGHPFLLPPFLLDDGNGDLRLKGHRITLYHVASRLRRGFAREALLEEFPSVPPALMDEVMAFCVAHPMEIAEYVAQYSEEIDRQIAGSESKIGLAELRRRFEAMRGAKA